MSIFENGVKAYITGFCTVEVNFPIDWKDRAVINCYLCKFFSRSNGICQLTKEISEFPDKYVGSHCPLQISDEIKEKE